jgi:sugar-specific transcriptional regulator TrmB
LPPSQVFSKLVEDKERESDIILNNIQKTSSFLIDSLEPRYWERRLGIRPADILEPLESLKSMEKKTINIINNAKTSVVIFAETFGWYEKVRETLVRALDRGVKISVLMLVLDKESAIRAKDLKRSGIEVRHCIEEWYPVRGTLSDIVELVFLIWATKKRDVPRPIRYKPHYTTNVGLIKVFTDAFKKRWEEARPI